MIFQMYFLKLLHLLLANKKMMYLIATSSMLGNRGKDEHLSPYVGRKSKNIELKKF